MAHSLEIRTPLADAELLREVAPTLRGAGRPSKETLIAGMGAELRALVEKRPKRGFQVPVKEWMRRDGRPHAQMRGWRGWALDVMAAFDGVPQAPII
jgi:hypothetical protein